jgi:hypothetical protein
VPWLREGCHDRLAGIASTSLLLDAQHVSGKHVPIVRSLRLRDVIDLCWYVPWLREGWQDRLAGSASTSFLLVAKLVSGNQVPSSGAENCMMLYCGVGRCRGCGKVVKTGWKVVRPHLFY